MTKIPYVLSNGSSLLLYHWVLISMVITVTEFPGLTQFPIGRSWVFILWNEVQVSFL